MFFVVGYVPETKGRDLDSIAKLFLKENEEKSGTESGKETSDTAIEITRL